MKIDRAMFSKSLAFPAIYLRFCRPLLCLCMFAHPGALRPPGPASGSPHDVDAGFESRFAAPLGLVATEIEAANAEEAVAAIRAGHTSVVGNGRRRGSSLGIPCCRFARL